MIPLTVFKAPNFKVIENGKFSVAFGFEVVE